MSKLVFALPLLLVILLAAAFRLPQLDDRPMHADEAVQAVRFRQLWIDGDYRYDPNEFHGPTMPYATLPSVWLGGVNEFSETTENTYRIVPALFGIFLILWLILLRDALGRAAAIAAGILAAISPAMVYYSRYYIHETMLTFFCLAAFACSWRYLRSGRLAWCLAAGACIGLMQATKETAVLAYVAALAATGISLVGWRGHENVSGATHWRWSHLAWGAVTAVAVAVLFYSSFGTNPQGPLDGVLTYLPWLNRASGQSPHIHSWHFYLSRLAWWRLAEGPRWSEGLILALAAVGFGVALAGPQRWLAGADRAAVRWLGSYTVVLTLIYTVIPYKTPWCMLQFLIGLILLAGVGAVCLVRATPTAILKPVTALVLLGLATQLGWQSYRASYVLANDACNPYVYAHTVSKVKDLEHILHQLMAASSDGRSTRVKVIWSGNYYWPIPWYLREFESVEYWNHVPDDAQAAIVISAPEHDEALIQQLDETHFMTNYYGIRTGVLAQLWVREDVWLAHLKRLGRL